MGTTGRAGLSYLWGAVALAGCAAAESGSLPETCAEVDSTLPVPEIDFLKVDDGGRLIGRLAVAWPTYDDGVRAGYDGLDALEVWIDPRDGGAPYALGEAALTVASGSYAGAVAENPSLGGFVLDPGDGAGVTRDALARVQDGGRCGPMSEPSPFVQLEPPQILSPAAGTVLDLMPDPVTLEFRAEDSGSESVVAQLVIVTSPPSGAQVEVLVASEEFPPASIDQLFEVAWSLIDAVREDQEQAIEDAGAGTVKMEWRVRERAPQGVRGDQEARSTACLTGWYNAGESTCYYGP